MKLAQQILWLIHRIAGFFLILSMLFIGLGQASANNLQQDSSDTIYLPVISNGSFAYYVSPSGSDLNPGTFTQPWRTIAKAALAVTPGTTVYVRAGIYKEAVSLNVSGTEGNPINFLAYPGETPVIDGYEQLPKSETGLLYVKGNWINISGFEVKNSTYYGIQLRGHHVKADNFYTHHSQRTGMWVQGDYSIVENSRIWMNALGTKSSAALSTGRDTIDGTTNNAILRNNMVWENWGIGITIHQSDGSLVDGNIVHNNKNGNLYVTGATNITCTGNFLYMTPGNITGGKGYGFLLGDDQVGYIQSTGIKLINNIAYGNKFNLKWYHVDERGPSDGMKDVLIANNTFVNIYPNSSGDCNIDIGEGSHQNVRILNNIVVQDDNVAIVCIEDIQGITLSHNLWSKSPNLSGSGTVGDPQFLKGDSFYIDTWYKLKDTSPAINTALALPEVMVDYHKVSRGLAPDMGALEHH